MTPQRQEGFSTVQVKVIRGDLTPDQFRALAQIMRDFSGGYARTTVHQNFLLRWVRNESVYDVWQALREIGLGDSGADEINDVVSCPGTDSCKLGITSSMGLNHAVRERIESMEITDPLTRRIHVKMSGCPNGCSQHHIANIGFYGASIKVGEHTIPAYVAHIGGTYEGGEVAYGTRLKVRLPAKRVPEAVERWLRMYEAEREENEAFNDYATRIGEMRFEDEARDLSLPVEFNLENMSTVHRLAAQGDLPGDPGGGRMRGVVGNTAEEVLATAVERHHPNLIMACSFQKEESVLIDMLMKIEPSARVFTIDTGALFADTYEVWRKVEDRYDLHVEVFDASSMNGPWTPENCCGPRKVAALAAGARRRGRLDHGHPPRAVPHARGRPEGGVDGDPRRVEVQPAGGLVGGRRVEVRARARPALPPASRPGLRLDRLRPLHPSRCRPRRPLGRAGEDGVRAARVSTREASVSSPGRDADHMTYEISHLRALESEAIHVIREVAAELERCVLLFSGGKDSAVLLHLARKAFHPGALPFPVMHVDTGHNFPEVIEYRDRLVAELGADLIVASRAGLDRQRPGGGGDGPAGVPQPAPVGDAPRRHRGARVQGGLRRRAPRRGARPGQGADPLLPGRLRPVGPEDPAARALEPLQQPREARASTCACSRCPTGPSSTCGST